MRKIIHIDMDAFFASVEQLDYPEYRNKPVIVGGTEGRGVVATASYEARKFGIHSAMPIVIARKKCPDGIFISPRFYRYREIAEIIFSIYKKYTTLVETLSLDEAFLDVTVNLVQEPSATRLAERIREEIKSTTGLTASAGVSFGKFFAKIASDLNKPNGLTVLNPNNWEKVILSLPVGKFHGIGRVTEKRLLDAGIKTGGDIRSCSKEELRKLFGKNGNYYYHIVRGNDNHPVVTERKRKSVGAENTFANDLLVIDEIHKELTEVVQILTNRAKKAEVKGRTVTLKIKYHDFIMITRSITLSTSINDFDTLMSVSLSLLKQTNVGKKKIRLIGVSLGNFKEEERGLFD